MTGPLAGLLALASRIGARVRASIVGPEPVWPEPVTRRSVELARILETRPYLTRGEGLATTVPAPKPPVSESVVTPAGWPDWDEFWRDWTGDLDGKP